MNLVAVPVADLRPDPLNARRHPDENVEAIMRSLAQFGQAEPLVRNSRTGFLIGGHGRLDAMKRLGWTEAQVVDLDLDEKKARALGVALNQTATLAEWDEARLASLLHDFDADDQAATGFDGDEVDDLIRDYWSEDGPGVAVTEGLTDPNDVPDAPMEPITKPGDLIVLGRHRLLCGDSTKAEDVARVMDGRHAEMVFTSPPYGVGVEYETYDDTFESIRAMIPAMANTWANVVVPGGFAVVNFSDIMSARAIADTDEPCEYPMALEYWPPFRAAGWLLWSRRVWCKPAAGTGSMQCIGSNRAATNWEHVWTWKRPGTPVVRDQISGEYASQHGWFDTIHDRRLDVGLATHGAGMPVAVAMRMISIHTPERGRVLEPFCGTGTTMIACEKLGRSCAAIEQSPIYCDIIVRRWEQFTGKQAQRPVV